MAFIIVAAGPVTACRMRTLSAGRVLAGAACLAAALVAGSVGLGYRLARGDEVGTGFDAVLQAGEATETAGDGVVVDRIGELAGRLTRLEAEAAQLAHRLGLPRPSAAKTPLPKPSAHADRDEDRPRGGPLLPMLELATGAGGAAVQLIPADETGLAQLEREIEGLESSIERMAAVAADRDLATMAYPSHLPVSGSSARISSGFGVRTDPFTGRLARHAGLDIPADHGTPILASGGGRVVSAGFRGPYGNVVVIDHGDGMQTLYGHCSRLYVRAGELVLPRQKIAAVGSTGRSTGPHLHFEVIRHGKRVAPGQVLASVLPAKAPR